MFCRSFPSFVRHFIALVLTLSCVGLLLRLLAVVLAVLQGPLFGKESVAQQALRAIWSLAVGDDNRRKLGIMGVCEGG